MARTMRDCALLLQAIAGYDPLDPCTVDEPVPDFSSSLNGSLQGVRIGVPREYFFDQPELDSELRAAVEAALQLMAQHGATVKDVRLPHASLSRTVQRVIMFGEAYAFHQTNLAKQAHRYGQHTRRQLLQGALYSAGDYVQAQRIRSVLKREALAAMADLDVLIMPTSVAVATVFEGYDPDTTRRAPTFMAMWNVTGQPAASICCGFSSQGLRMGMQIVGRPFDEATVLRVGDAYQQLTDWHTRTPEVAREVQTA
jgi:aspartyl-tRNA(Asn)/glutamyl-tRNA(Gln) amidotransferase subunit A